MPSDRSQSCRNAPKPLTAPPAMLQHQQPRQRAGGTPARHPRGPPPGLRGCRVQPADTRPLEEREQREALCPRPGGDQAAGKHSPEPALPVESPPPGLPRSLRLKHAQTPCRPAPCRGWRDSSVKTGTWAKPQSKSLASPSQEDTPLLGYRAQNPGDPETGKALFQSRTTATPRKHRGPSKSGSWPHREPRSSHTLSPSSALKTEVTPRRNGWKPSKRARPVSSRRRGEKPSHNTAVQSAQPATCCKDRGPGPARGEPKEEWGRPGAGQ